MDLDAFYASVEQRDDPTLRGKPVIVGGESNRGVVCAASYEARSFGVKSAMAMVTARRLCPRGIVLRPRHAHYSAVSRDFFAILGRYSPLVEGLSLDEAFLDVTGQRRLFGDGPAIASRIRSDVKRELALVASVGVAPTKHSAKIASDLDKPDGLVVVTPEEHLSFLAPLPVERLWGVGPRAAKVLRASGLSTVGDIARTSAALLGSRLGPDMAAHIIRLAQGIDERPVVPERAPVSIGHEDTFDTDLFDRALLTSRILEQADRVCSRLRRGHLRARTIQLKVKYANHELVTRRRTLEDATCDSRVAGPAAVRLLDRVTGIERRGVRLTGVSLSGLEPDSAPRQLALDQRASHKGESLGTALDHIADRFGTAAIARATRLKE